MTNWFYRGIKDQTFLGWLPVETFSERVLLEEGFWFSPQGDHLVYLTINSTKVEELYLDIQINLTWNLV